jgi:hypothetical protein
MAGQRTHGSDDTEHQICNCKGVENMDQDDSMPSVPHSSHIRVHGSCPYALVDTGASPNLVKTSWLAKIVPGWRKHVDETHAARTTFKLADGGRSSTPKGTIELPIEMGGVCVTRKFWVLDELTTNMILGSDFLLHIGATIDYGMCEIRSRQFDEMNAVPFDLKGAHQWRRATSVVALYDIVLRPNRVEMGGSPKQR